MTAVMQPAAWIGECPEHALSGWSYFRTVADFASSGLQVDRIIVDDPAASLREVDCITLFTAAPLARIIRRVGPWRAGIERTDPQWPATTTVVTDSIDELLVLLNQESLPLTAAYDERAAAESGFDLTDVRVDVVISDSALRATWQESLRDRGAILAGDSGVDLLVTDGDVRETRCWTICLSADPWNIPQTDYLISMSVLDHPDRAIKVWLARRDCSS